MSRKWLLHRKKVIRYSSSVTFIGFRSQRTTLIQNGIIYLWNILLYLASMAFGPVCIEWMRPRGKTFRYSCVLASWILFYFGRIHQSWPWSYVLLSGIRINPINSKYVRSTHHQTIACINYSKISTTFIFSLQKDNYIPNTITTYWKKRNEE